MSIPMPMKPPEHVTLFEGELATFWFDEQGILCALSKSTARSLEKQKKNSRPVVTAAFYIGRFPGLAPMSAGRNKIGFAWC